MRQDRASSGGWTLAGENRYLYDGMRVPPERDASNTPQVTYTHTRGLDLSGSFAGAGGIGGLLARSHGYRWYSPSLQRWISWAPIGEEGFGTRRNRKAYVPVEARNLFWFVRQNPLTWVDPVGLSTLLPETDSQSCFQNCLSTLRARAKTSPYLSGARTTF